MTIEEFRRLALSFPEAEERQHMGHPDFRVHGHIFATLGYPDAQHGVVNLTPEQQQAYMKASPKVFIPAKGAWGRKGSTTVYLSAATEASLRGAMGEAWQLASGKKPARTKRAK